jgi:omega-hydroxy-beta-dihydromenaquinone-9 sulfotransferase
VSAEAPIVRPIFVIGCGRSGTTVVYDLLCAHEQLAWFSNYTERFSAPWLAALSRSRRYAFARDRLGRFAPRPHEAHGLWDACTPDKDAAARNAPLTAADARADEVQCLRSIVRSHLRYQGKRRFVNKNTRNSRRIGYLDAVFPDALFIHVTRDPRATVASLLRVHFWPTMPIWWCEDRTPEQLVNGGRDPVTLAAEFWSRELWQIRNDSSSLPPERYLVVRYEELVDSPYSVLDQILGFAQLKPSKHVRAAIDRMGIENRNLDFAKLFGSQLHDVERITASEAGYLGYPPH